MNIGQAGYKQGNTGNVQLGMSWSNMMHDNSWRSV